MMTEVNEARDWQGESLDCSACCHNDLRPVGGCKLLQACVRDRYARRIDRFFSWNRPLANDYLDHPYFEVRAVAARIAAQHLPAMLEDSEQMVRELAEQRLSALRAYASAGPMGQRAEGLS